MRAAALGGGEVLSVAAMAASRVDSYEFRTADFSLFDLLCPDPFIILDQNKLKSL